MDDDDDDNPSQVEQWEEEWDALPYEEQRFEKIPEAERLHPERKLCGILKLASLLDNPAKGGIAGAEHDVIWLDGPEIDQVDRETYFYLQRCGVFWSTEYDCWTAFV